MSGQELQVGAVVTLKSGGPAMTITSIGTYDHVLKAVCQWFDNTKLDQGLLPLTSLELVKEPASSVSLI